jgi:hypothetical protein
MTLAIVFLLGIYTGFVFYSIIYERSLVAKAASGERVRINGRFYYIKKE